MVNYRNKYEITLNIIYFLTNTRHKYTVIFMYTYIFTQILLLYGRKYSFIQRTEFVYISFHFTYTGHNTHPSALIFVMTTHFFFLFVFVLKTGILFLYYYDLNRLIYLVVLHTFKRLYWISLLYIWEPRWSSMKLKSCKWVSYTYKLQKIVNFLRNRILGKMAF